MSGKPIDIVAGDFNAVGRSVEFRDIADAGFVSVGGAVPGWRPTWLAICPLYDIDHLSVGGRFAPSSAQRFTNLNADHRGIAGRLARSADADR